MTNNTKTQQPKSSLSATRRTIQYISLLITILLGLRHIMPGESSKGGAFDAFCPFGGIETLWAYITTGHTLKTTNLLNFSVLLGVVGVSLVGGRAFCGWMCPIGTLQDILAGWTSRLESVLPIRKREASPQSSRRSRRKARFPIPLPPKWDKWLRYLKYLILVLILIASVKSVYPPLREICPARAIFSFQLTTGLLWSVLITFIITSMLNKRFWCKYLCPLGAALAVFNKITPLRIVSDDNNCTACGHCDTVCPMDIITVPENLRSAECIQCLECIEACPVPDTLELKLG